MVDAELLDAAADPVELVLADEEGVVLCLDREVRGGELHACRLAEVDDGGRAPGRGIGAAVDLGEEGRRDSLVLGNRMA